MQNSVIWPCDNGMRLISTIWNVYHNGSTLSTYVHMYIQWLELPELSWNRTNPTSFDPIPLQGTPMMYSLMALTINDVIMLTSRKTSSSVLWGEYNGGEWIPLTKGPYCGTRVSVTINNNNMIMLTHWGRVTHICVSKLTINGSDNGLSPGRRQAIT